MKRHVKQIVLWAAFLLLPVSVDAQITDYTGSLGSTEYMNFLNTPTRNGAEISTWTHDGSRVYVGPYVGSFGQNVTSPQFSLICVDFENFAGSQWVDVTGLGSGQTEGGVGSTRLGSNPTWNGQALSTYRSAAFLGSLFDSWQTLGDDRRTVFSAIHSAIWSILSVDNIGGSGTDDYLTLRLALLERAANEGQNFGADGWYVLSSAVEGGEGYQEMLIRTPASTVPEPSTYLLMATGLLFLVFFGRKRMGELDKG